MYCIVKPYSTHTHHKSTVHLSSLTHPHTLTHTLTTNPSVHLSSLTHPHTLTLTHTHSHTHHKSIGALVFFRVYRTRLHCVQLTVIHGEDLELQQTGGEGGKRTSVKKKKVRIPWGTGELGVCVCTCSYQITRVYLYMYTVHAYVCECIYVHVKCRRVLVQVGTYKTLV